MDGVDAAPQVDQVLSVQLIDENRFTRVETVILNADSFNTVGTRAIARFTVVPKGSVLAPNTKLIFKATWPDFNPAADAGVSFPRFPGALTSIAEARLFCGGLIEQTQLAGRKAFLESLATPYDAQNEIVDVLQGGNHGYTYDAAGLMTLTSDPTYTEAGYRGLTATSSATQEVQVPLDRLFATLKDVLLPTFLRDPVVVELEWRLDGDQICCLAGQAKPGAIGNITIHEPRLMCEYLVLPEPMLEAMRSSFMSPDGVVYPFRQSNLVIKNAAAIAGTAAASQTNDFELGFANQRVTKLMIQNELPYAANQLLGVCKSDGIFGLEMNAFVNNQQMFNRDVSLMSDFYTYLSQTYGASAKIPANGYELIGQLAANNPVNDNVIQPSVDGVAETGTQEFLQGKFRPLGINFAQQRGNRDDPSNALLIGDAPIVVRMKRTIPANGGTTARGEAAVAAQRGALTSQFFVETVKMMRIADGQVMISEA